MRYIEVFSVFISLRGAVEDETIPIFNAVAVGELCVIVHRYHPSRHGIIVDVTATDLIPIVPFKRSKFAKFIVSFEKQICAKLLVPRRR